MSIGEIEGIKESQAFVDRRDLHEAGVHRALQHGIVGQAREGAESIVLSGGYVDDEDLGNEIIYTGFGGRDAATGKQVANQRFEDQNQALVTSSLNGTPVRVVRGSHTNRTIRQPVAIAMMAFTAPRAIGQRKGKTGLRFVDSGCLKKRVHFKFQQSNDTDRNRHAWSIDINGAKDCS